MPRWERNSRGISIRGIKKTPVPQRSHTQDRVKLEFLNWARESNHPEAWREFMRSLSGLQCKAIFLIFEHGQNPVKTLSRFGFEDETTMSSVLFKLKKLGIVSAQKSGRESIYSISESGLIEFLHFGSHGARRKANAFDS